MRPPQPTRDRRSPGAGSGHPSTRQADGRAVGDGRRCRQRHPQLTRAYPASYPLSPAPHATIPAPVTRTVPASTLVPGAVHVFCTVDPGHTSHPPTPRHGDVAATSTGTRSAFRTCTVTRGVPSTHTASAETAKATEPRVPGAPNGVTGADGADASDVPAAFVAVTVNVYAVPFASPVTVHAVVSVVHVAPPGCAVTVEDVTALPPSSDGAVHDTSAAPLPAAAVTPVGADGTVAGGCATSPGHCATVSGPPAPRLTVLY